VSALSGLGAGSPAEMAAFFRALSTRRVLSGASVTAAATAVGAFAHAQAAPRLFSTCEEHPLHGGAEGPHCLLVSLPLSYTPSASERHPVLYVLGGEPYLFSLVATAARIGKYTASLEQRSWYPDLIVVGISSDVAGATAVPELWNANRQVALSVVASAIEHVDATYRTQPYAGGRAIIGHGLGGDVLARALCDDALEGFESYMIGSPTCLDTRITTSSEPPKAKAALVCVGSEERDEAQQAAKRLHRTLQAALGGKAGEMHAMVHVDRDGHQRVEELESAPDSGAAAVTLDVMVGEGARTAPFAFAARAVEWLAARMERAKIERLHRHLPWHEFR
jgi:hypothetical protein